VKITVAPDKKSKFTVAVRIPGWARNEVLPGDLYKFSDKTKLSASLKINGKNVPLKLEKGYASLERDWKSGDVIELKLPMPVRRIIASENVLADRGRIALQRGPIVFCAEWPDNAEGKVRDLILPNNQSLTAKFEPQLLNGVETISGKAFTISKNADGKIVKTMRDYKAIPYFAWANRGKGEMAVWFANSETNSDIATLSLK
jgi:DUF1680 family protein